MKTANELRSLFLDYFKGHDHTVVESSSLVPHNDPTLLFTNAGMVQFKDVFLGNDPRPYKRATSSQKCVRAGGKHNDLENVGFTARHHTFFEMLGNFSFGDYFKKDAIHYAWEFVTKNLKIDKDRLYVTVHIKDDDAAKIWETQEKVPTQRISRFDADNFWAMGDTGPCGPCSEIFVDRGEKYGCKKPDCKVGCSCDRYMEIWNLVFMQFERSADGKLSDLPKPSIDTGMGLERLASVIQNVSSNYDTDLFQTIIQFSSKLSGVKYGKSPETDVSLRVLADHCRATNFLISDGVLPSNEGRGYVLRRIMRRAIRHGRNLGFKEPFFYKLSNPLVELMQGAYPDLTDKKAFLENTIKLEEEKFLTTLDNGLHLLEQAMSESKEKIISGKTAFKLYDTFGFPLDLTEVIAREKGFQVDTSEFDKEMGEQRARSKEHWKGSGEEAVGSLYKELQQKKTKTKFRVYDTLNCKGKVLAIIEGEKFVSKTSQDTFQLIVDESPFYAESGGQVGDHGELVGTNFKAKVIDVKKPTGDFIVLICKNVSGQLTVGDSVEQSTDRLLRSRTAKNHTATHMLHHALRKFLGSHIKQAGSLVTPDLLRFDFTHNKPLTLEEIEKIEDFINDSISRSENVGSQEMDKDSAIKKGAIAFFGDKYGSQVRVISVGDYSVELCGGTHVRNTADIQNFKILNENGIAAGVRRIVAVTGNAVIELLRKREKELHEIMDTVKASAPAEIVPKIEKLILAEKDARKALEAQSRKQASGEIEQWISGASKLGDKSLVKAVVPLLEGEVPSKKLREISDLIRSKTTKTVVALGAVEKAKGQSLLLIAVTKDLTSSVQANDLIRKVAPILGGSGGGKPDIAQAGGKNEKFDEAFKMVESLLTS
ncbi:MAG: alanine--tRNA ligase [Bacteriovoracia bacterium]